MAAYIAGRSTMLPAVIAFVLLGIGALAVFGGAFARGVALGASGSLALVVVLLILLRRLMARLAGGGLKAPALPVRTWDHDMAATNLSGEAVAFQQFANQVLVLNVWGTWCAPCVAEMPSLFRLQERLTGYDIRFAFVSTEKPEVVRKFIKKRGWQGPFYQVDSELPECFQTGAIPATFVIDRDGSIALRHLGAARWDDEKVVTFLQGLTLDVGGSADGIIRPARP